MIALHWTLLTAALAEWASIKLVEDIPTPAPTPIETPVVDAPNPAPVSGPPQFAHLATECVEASFAGFNYKLCPFVNVTQSQGSFSYSLGVWSKWDEEGQAAAVEAATEESAAPAASMLYESGTACSDGSLRTSSVQLKCAEESALVSVAEPSTCKYTLIFETPAACEGGDPSVGDAPSMEGQIFGDAVEGGAADSAAAAEAGAGAAAGASSAAPCTEVTQCNDQIAALAAELKQTRAVGEEAQRVLQAVLSSLVAPAGERASQLDAVLVATAAAADAAASVATESAVGGCDGDSAAGDASCAPAPAQKTGLGALLGALSAPFTSS